MIDSTEKHLVTFAVFAYNQEKYISEAVESAFAQDYSPLEIILSDDCSNDDTFEIMQAMADAYIGPHTVHVNRNVRNLGLAVHINEVVGLAHGEYIAVAAGDDISKNDRVSSVMSHFAANEKIDVIHTLVEIIDDNSKFVQLFENRFRTILDDPFEILKNFAYLTGPSVVFRKRFISIFPKLNNDVVNEDVVWAFRSSLSKSSRYLDFATVKYRKHAASISHRNASSSNVGIGKTLIENDDLLKHTAREVAFLKQCRLDLNSGVVSFSSVAKLSRCLTMKLRRETALHQLMSMPSFKSFLRALYITGQALIPIKIYLRFRCPNAYEFIKIKLKAT